MRKLVHSLAVAALAAVAFAAPASATADGDATQGWDHTAAAQLSAAGWDHTV